MKRCIIVADGPSARGFIPPPGVTIIAVKGAINWLLRADYWFSLDPNERTSAMLANRRPGVIYAVACDMNTRLPHGVVRYKRKVAPSGPEPWQTGSPEWWMWRWRAVPGLCDIHGTIHTGNSAWGALGMAWHLGFRDVLLIGVDGTDDQRTSDGKRPNNLSHLPLLFQSVGNQLRLQSVSSNLGLPVCSVTEWMNP